MKNEFVEVIEKTNDQFGQLQMQMKMQQSLASEQMRTLKLMQDQMQQLQYDQGRLTSMVAKVAGPDAMVNSYEEE